MEANFGEGGFRNTALALQVRGTYKTRRTLQYMNKLGLLVHSSTAFRRSRRATSFPSRDLTGVYNGQRLCGNLISPQSLSPRSKGKQCPFLDKSHLERKNIGFVQLSF
jgi:hypothetical protein